MNRTDRKEIEEVLGVVKGTVIVGQGNVTVLLTVINGFAIWHGSSVWARNPFCVGALGTDVGIASWAVVYLTGWSGAVEVAIATPSEKLEGT